MTEECAFSQQNGMRRVCGLLGMKETSGGEYGELIALREIVRHFEIEWKIAALASSNSGSQGESGFTVEMKGRHAPIEHSVGQPCSHCANLMLSLRIIAEWLLPPGESCSFCRAEASTTFVNGDRHRQEAASSTRTLCVSSGPGTPCQLARCHELCMGEIRERLGLLGAAERKRNDESGRRAGR